MKKGESYSATRAMFLHFLPSAESFSMKRLGIGLLVLGISVSTALPAHAQKKGRGKDNSAQHGWMSSYGAARELARKTGKPLMVVIRCVP